MSKKSREPTRRQIHPKSAILLGIKRGAKPPLSPLHHPEDQDFNQDHQQPPPDDRTSTPGLGIFWT